MASVSRDDVESVTDRLPHNSWSGNIEKPKHADGPDLVAAKAIDAVNHTAAGHHVNLVTHGTHGHPRGFLYPALTTGFGGDLGEEYVKQCRCGGHVTRAYGSARRKPRALARGGCQVE
ncbi:CGCGG family putative rSAM-modified RiPP protein [Halobellus sp. GM3]|uniref:CGCGG family putative rSAM-modified RiPP protein n=1 Tax=Halobellus sp. GM3 TaxID=3458410 RepID=UPI00403DA711